MNVPLPGIEETAIEFWVIIALMVATLAGVLFFFRKRGFL
jgi:Mg2+ and Co2+ transporter CorA